MEQIQNPNVVPISEHFVSEPIVKEQPMNLSRNFCRMLLTCALSIGMISTAAAAVALSLGQTLLQDQASLWQAEAQLSADLLARNTSAIALDKAAISHLSVTIRQDEAAIFQALQTQIHAVQLAQTQLRADIRAGNVLKIAADVTNLLTAQDTLEQASIAIGLPARFSDDFGFDPGIRSNH
jgi:hypothetical protein